MPTSVLLAVLAAAALLALAPALTRRHDTTDRFAAERAMSSARVLSRRRRRRSVPGLRPINPPRSPRSAVRGPRAAANAGVARAGAAAGVARSGVAQAVASSRVGAAEAGGGSRAHRPRAPARRAPGWHARRAAITLQRRRRVLLALVLLNAVELAGVVMVGPGFWIGFSVSSAILLVYLVYLRRQAVVRARRRAQRRAQRHRTAWIAAEQSAARGLATPLS